MVYTSPLRRCVETAAYMADSVPCPKAEMADLVDLDFGTLQWITYTEAKATHPGLFAMWLSVPHLVRFPSGEALQDLVARTARALHVVIERHPSDTVVMVGHDNVNRALLLQLLDQPLSAFWHLLQAPCAVNEIDINGPLVRVHRINDTSHIS